MKGENRKMGADEKEGRKTEGTRGAKGLRRKNEKYDGKSARTPFAKGVWLRGEKPRQGIAELVPQRVREAKEQNGLQRSQGRSAYFLTMWFRAFNATRWHPSSFTRHGAPSPNHRRVRKSLTHFHCLGRKGPPQRNSAREAAPLEGRFIQACVGTNLRE